MRAQRYIALYFPFVLSLSTLTSGLVLLVAAGQMRSGALTAGALIAYLLYIDMLFSPVQQISQVFDGYQQAAVGLRRISDLLRTPTSTPQAEHPLPSPRGRARIELRDVCFGYGTDGRQALVGVNLVVGQSATVDLSLPVGESSQQVTVNGDAPLVGVNTEDISGLVGEQQIRNQLMQSLDAFFEFYPEL